MKVLVTGGAGLVGSECARLFCEKGWSVKTIDNYMRGRIFGHEGDTHSTMAALLKKYDIEHHELDIRDSKCSELLQDADVIIHTAAQPSHPRSIDIPWDDFEINAVGTFLLLERLRQSNKNVVFVFCSTNKVYGDAPNYYAYDRVGRRFEPTDRTIHDGFDEGLRIDQCLHTPFGVSKCVADLYTQEYARLYGLKTGVFRMGCITGGAAMAVEQHNWEPFFVRKAITGEELVIFGYDGYQVRDVIHARDLAELFLEFAMNPRPGEVYNVGGGRGNSISMLESMDLIEEVTGRKIRYRLGPEREGDHKWWVTNMKKVRSHYPSWNVRFALPQIFKEIYDAQIARVRQ